MIFLQDEQSLSGIQSTECRLGRQNKNAQRQKKISQNKKWIISEIFNTVILNQKDFEKIIKPAKELGYPEHKRYIKILENKWKKEKNITKWISQANQIVP